MIIIKTVLKKWWRVYKPEHVFRIKKQLEDNKMIIIKTVLKSGGAYKPEHVFRIKKQLEDNVSVPFKFVCYSDMEFDGCEIRPLTEGWSGWYSKIEMFKDVEESFYIDLDMVINNDITDMVEFKTNFCAMRNLDPKIDGLGSAVMKWSGDRRFIFDEFKNNYDYFMGSMNKLGTKNWGDQGVINYCLKTYDVDYWQDIFPNRISSFRKNKNSDIVAYFGVETPWGRKELRNG